MPKDMRRLVLGLGLLVVVAACGSSFTGDDQASGADDGGGADGSATNEGGNPLMTGGDAGPGGGGPQPGAEGGAPLDGIFVSAKSGKDTNDGSMAHPLQTLKAAIGLGTQFHKSVIACNETYLENLAVVDGTSVYGNYDCATNPKAWGIAATNAVLKAPKSPALTADGIMTGTTIGHIDIVAPAAGGAELSSVGALVKGSKGLELAGLLITTGDAQNGTNGADGAQLVDDANIAGTGATGGTNTCGGSATYAGATGGNGGITTDTCKNIAATNPNHAKTRTATKAKVDFYNGGAVTSGATAPGTFSPTSGYVPGDGSAGTNGSGGTATDGVNGVNLDIINDIDNGMVGGKTVWSCQCDPAPQYAGSCVQAGSNATSTSTAGAPGKAGGCPGLAGKAGTGGGASVGVIVFDFAITLTTVSIQTGKGGDGGKGTAGSAPTTGAGAPGTQPGTSASGVGGPSVGVAYKGSPPDFVKGAKGSVTLGLTGAGASPITSADTLRTVAATNAGAHADYYPIP